MSQRKASARDGVPAATSSEARGASTAAGSTPAELRILRNELDKAKRDLIAANRRVRELEASRTEALQRLDTVIRSITDALRK